MFNYSSTDKQIGIHSKKAGIQPAKWRILPTHGLIELQETRSLYDQI